MRISDLLDVLVGPGFWKVGIFKGPVVNVIACVLSPMNSVYGRGEYVKITDPACIL